MSKELKDHFDRVQGSFLEIRPDLILGSTENSKEYAEIKTRIENVRDNFRETNDFVNTLKKSLSSNLAVPRKWLRSVNVQESKEIATTTKNTLTQHRVRINNYGVVLGITDEALTKQIRSISSDLK